ncbi:SF1B family DNA helicase RecD2 [Candidatus Chromulinivorax destructor]|uniref:ATP-dependent RecD-like DNA helicase n=1 Tax=Candidatus Chromulinivorax destructor TaxID=2066483 RepID=A0A345ZBC0_9BACT|nr:ATP-dependent RecD-like DNA helicase [Candidatus Chromulinivorax destructor]AXK60587.1 ATP-dependent RecD-like DNA helicase [Candidatus Chromulinivorax destructor]
MTEDEIFGLIDRFVYQNAETGFAILILKTKEKLPVTVTGNFVNIHEGQELYVKGAWVYNQKFGKQFQSTSYYSKLPNNIAGLKKYLGSGLIKGIGKSYADKIVNHFKEKTLMIIDSMPHRLSEIPGIGSKRVEQITQSWSDQKYIAEIMIFLQDKGVTTTYATKIYKKYKNNSIPLLTEDPYRLIYDIWGIGFKTADMIAQNLGFELSSVKRVKAGILFNLHEATKQGHLYQELSTLKNSTFHLLDLHADLHAAQMKHALHQLHDEEKIKLITYNNEHFLTTTAFYFSEKSLATKIQAIVEYPSPHTFNMNTLYKKLQEHQHIQLNEQQQLGVLGTFQHKISVITGGPGTGKTTVIKALLTLLEQENMRYKLAAPTGRAAKKMMEGTGRPATTIHRLLEVDPANMQFKHNDQNALEVDFLIIDEASMIDIFLALAIIKATPLPAHIIFIGDIHQLPSVGPGNFLHDLIASKKAPTTTLSQIFRQAQNSMIITNAYKINQGEMPSTDLPDCKKDFYFIKEDNPENVMGHIKTILLEKLPRHHINSSQAIILSPMHKGAVGTQQLNHDLQLLLNPEQKASLTYAGTTFKLHDRVMQIKNNYDKKVFNGDVGVIDTIDPEEKIVSISFDYTNAVYSFDELNELSLAYALTIHKSQGSEYEAVIIPIFMQHFTLLQRNLIYTAITRAKKLCFFIGQPKAVAMAVKNNKTIERLSFLNRFLTEDIACR